MKKYLQKYTKLPNNVIRVIIAVFLLNLNNSAFMLILNIYLRKLGYSDELIASFVSYRFLAVLLFAFPIGLLIKGRALKKMILAATFIVPVSAAFILEAIVMNNIFLIKLLFGFWGVGMMLIQVAVLPFIMRNTPQKQISEAISLNFSMWSLGMIVAGFVITFMSVLSKFLLFHVNEGITLAIIISFSGFAFLFILRLKEKIPVLDKNTNRGHFSYYSDYNWSRIIKAIIPTMIIAIGAGLTIPFMNLFFFSVFHIDYEQFSLLGGSTALLVFISSLLVPFFRHRYGYKKTIISTQLTGIFFLVVLASTQLISTLPGIIYLAFFAYLLRQPLMNMSGPVSSELTLEYVGEKSQELISALHSSIWSASWFLSAKVFQILRAIDVPYYKIFFITSGFYLMGTILYYYLILDYEKNKDNNPEIQN